MKTKRSKFHYRLFWAVVLVFLSLFVAFIVLQYTNIKTHKVELLNSRLTGYNDYLNAEITKGFPVDSIVNSNYSRTTILDLSGKVIYDTWKDNVSKFENHKNRKEINDAIKNGCGYDVARVSETTGKKYFYSAKRYENLIIRSALPYDTNLNKDLKVNYTFIVITFFVTLILGTIFYLVMKRLGENINRLSDFAKRADRDEIITLTDFPHNELGEISKHIVQIYNRLKKTKRDLEIEKENVIYQQQEQMRLKRQLTQNVAHELKTPVSSIQGYLETIINNKDLPKETLDGFIDKCYRQSTRLTSLVHDISYLAQIDEAPDLIEKENIDIAKTINTIIEDANLQLKQKKITVHNDVVSPIECFGSPSLIYSIFRNLIDNSIAYAGEDIDIYIDCYKTDKTHYYFSYSDTGIGVAPEHLPRLFERFYRVDKGRSRKAGGTGLGLAIVKNSVIFHNGTIVAKERHGGGIEFLFSIEK